MGSDSVAVGECAIMFGNDTAISQQDGAALERFDLDQLAVDEVPTRRHRVGLQEQFVASGDSERSLRREVASTTAELGLVLTQPCLSRQVFYGSRRLAGGASHCQGSGAS